MLVTTDQIGHFLKPLDVFGNTPNLRVCFWNLAKIIIIIINISQTMLVTTDEIGHFLKPLDVFGNTPNLMVGFWNLP